MALKSIVYDSGSPPASEPSLQILNQLLLPHQTVYVRIRNSRAAFAAIKQMLVRGAPAIALVAALALAVEDPFDDVNPDHRPKGFSSEMTELEASAPCPAQDYLPSSATSQELAQWYVSRLDYLVQSRPTAVNLADAARKLSVKVKAAADTHGDAASVRRLYINAATQMLEDDVQDNENIGRCGTELLIRTCQLTKENKGAILTHCNTGALATAGYGTALGIVRSLNHAGLLQQAYYTETRPYNQGSRLTGYELLHDSIPATLITDSMAASLFKLKAKSDNIVAVIVGADRVAANGDTANKIGTYALACLARLHGVRFVVAAPRTTIDMTTASGDDIIIEERPAREMLEVKGPFVQGYESNLQRVDVGATTAVSTAALGTKAWNPAFDITPAELIDAIVTEVGVAEKLNGRFALGKLFE